jgi:hypothetical protein
MGLWNYGGMIGGKKAIVSRKAYDDRYIEISIAKDEVNQPETENPEETEEEKRRNRSEAMKGNRNARKYGPKPQSKAEMKAEEEDVKKSRARAGMPLVEKHGRSSTMKDSTWDPKSKEYRYRDTGYIAGARKELVQAYIRKMAKEGSQVTNDSIDWTGIEENDIAAAEIITKQNLMGKPDWENLRAAGLAGNAGYLINEIYKTINSKPEKSTADTRYNFSRGLDAIRGRFEACKTLEEVKAVVGDINGEMTGYYVSSIKTPEYLALAQKREEQNEKIKNYLDKLKQKIYDQGDPYQEADTFIKEKMGIMSGKIALINNDSGKWKGSYYDSRGKDELLKLLRKGDREYLRRQAEIEERSGVKLDDMNDQLRDIGREMMNVQDAKNKELSLVNDMKEAWGTFGSSFRKAVAVITRFSNSGYWGASLPNDETFIKHYNKAQELANDDFTWAEKKATGGGTAGPRKTQFELLVADHIVRNGGREVNAESTEALKNMFNLRDVQSGNWVLNDPKSAKFHVENIAKGLADLADITGIPDNLVSLNGRLAIAIGARGHSKYAAHYEPVERVINITKMRGGGSLGHEWFHAFDNIMADAMTGGRYNIYLTENGRYNDLTDRQRKLFNQILTYKRWMNDAKEDSYYRKSYEKSYEEAKAAAKKAGVRVDEIETSEDHVLAVKNAFAKLAATMMTGTATRTQDIFYTKDDYAYVNSNEGKQMLNALNISKDSMDFQEALEKASRYRKVYGKKQDQVKRLIAAYYDGDSNGGGKSAKTKENTSHFYENAKKLETNPGKPYWSSILEMGARAFSAYLNDKMAERGWQNNYLAHATENEKYTSHSPYPAGEEREVINAAFDELFRAINENNAIRKAIDLENMERLVPESAGVIDAAIDGALRFFVGLKRGRGSFDREKVILNRAGETIEDYRWVAKQPDIQLALEKKEAAPHAELVQETHGGKKTIAVDFDGVINSYKSGWQGPNETDEPVLNAAEGISGLWNRGNKIIIFSTRANTHEGTDTIREYIRRHTENDLLANSIEITDKKPIADVYIDDRAIPFTGDWEETLKQIETFKPWMDKSLTYSGYPLQSRMKVQGMDISIENKKGSTRSGADKDGHEWHTEMHYDYGYIRGTVGVDKDHLDCYVGPNPESEIAYIVNQNDPVTGKFDEQKVMLGFNSEVEAKAAYLKQYDRPGFFGDIVKMDIDTFKEEAFNPGNKGKPLKRREK